MGLVGGRRSRRIDSGRHAHRERFLDKDRSGPLHGNQRLLRASRPGCRPGGYFLTVPARKERTLETRHPMIGNRHLIRFLLLASLLSGASAAVAKDATRQSASQLGVGAQYDTTHVYVAPEDVDKFATSFLATFGGQSTKQVVATVTPTPSSTTSQLLQTPVGTVSVFGFKTPIPYPFGAERTGDLVTDIDEAVEAAKTTGADVLVTP